MLARTVGRKTRRTKLRESWKEKTMSDIHKASKNGNMERKIHGQNNIEQINQSRYGPTFFLFGVYIAI